LAELKKLTQTDQAAVRWVAKNKKTNAVSPAAGATEQQKARHPFCFNGHKLKQGTTLFNLCQAIKSGAKFDLE